MYPKLTSELQTEIQDQDRNQKWTEMKRQSELLFDGHVPVKLSSWLGRKSVIFYTFYSHCFKFHFQLLFQLYTDCSW